jgi:palmitoyltransferase
MFKILKKLIPREKADRFGVGATLFLISLVCVNGLHKLSKTYEEYPNYSLTIFLAALYTLINVLGNMYMAITIDTTIYSVKNLPTSLLADWRYCAACEQNAPPRAYHCFTCDKCVLKRHNHCLFLGKCAGHNNFRYYILFIFHVLIACLISNILNFDFFQTLFANFSINTILILFMPWLAVCLGMVTIGEVCLVFANSLCFILFMLMSLYFYVNFSMALRGQTWHEKAKNITIYNLEWKENFLEIFGSNWLLVIFFPFVKSKLPSDGTKFRRNNFEPTNQHNEMQNSYYNPNENHILRRK